VEPTSIRRRYLRKDISVPISFVWEKEKRSCLAITLGEGGLYAETVIPLPLGARLELEFDLPTDVHVKVTGEVRHSLGHDYGTLPAGFGVQFLDLSEKDRKSIIDWVESGV
jgi:hypothetical protein